MGSTFSYNYLPPATTASIAKMIDLGLIDSNSIVGKPDRRETAYLQECIREYLDYKKSNNL
jgi:hypothetical protein